MRGARCRPLAAAVILLAGSPGAIATDFVMDPAASRLEFRAVAENAEFGGAFTRFDSRARFDPAAPGAGRIEATVDLASVDTANGQRDELLVGTEWFHSSRWPQARFVTRRIVAAGQGYRAEADLTLRDVTRPVVMNLTWQPGADGSARLRGTVHLQRLDFGVGQGEWSDIKYIGNGVTVEVDVRYIPESMPP